MARSIFDMLNKHDKDHIALLVRQYSGLGIDAQRCSTGTIDWFFVNMRKLNSFDEQLEWVEHTVYTGNFLPKYGGACELYAKFTGEDRQTLEPEDFVGKWWGVMYDNAEALIRSLDGYSYPYDEYEFTVILGLVLFELYTGKNVKGEDVENAEAPLAHAFAMTWLDTAETAQEILDGSE